MLDIGWSELLVIGVVALIVVGPKDLPGLFRSLGQFTAKMRRMAREFSRAMEDAADASGAKDVARDLRTMTSPRAMGADAFKKATNLDLDDPLADPGEEEAAAREAADGTKTKPATGPNTRKLSEERAEAARKIREHSADRARARQAEATADAPATGEMADAGAVVPEPADRAPADRAPAERERGAPEPAPEPAV